MIFDDSTKVHDALTSAGGVNFLALSAYTGVTTDSVATDSVGSPDPPSRPQPHLKQPGSGGTIALSPPSAWVVHNSGNLVNPPQLRPGSQTTPTTATKHTHLACSHQIRLYLFCTNVDSVLFRISPSEIRQLAVILAAIWS
jgi:hypothetical protein